MIVIDTQKQDRVIAKQILFDAIKMDCGNPFFLAMQKWVTTTHYQFL